MVKMVLNLMTLCPVITNIESEWITKRFQHQNIFIIYNLRVEHNIKNNTVYFTVYFGLKNSKFLLKLWKISERKNPIGEDS